MPYYQEPVGDRTARLRALAELADVSQTAIARRRGVTIGAINAEFRGRRNVSAATLIALYEVAAERAREAIR